MGVSNEVLEIGVLGTHDLDPGSGLTGDEISNASGHPFTCQTPCGGRQTGGPSLSTSEKRAPSQRNIAVGPTTIGAPSLAP